MENSGTRADTRTILIAIVVVGLLLPVSGCTSSDEDKDDDQVKFNMTFTRTTPRDTGVTTVWDAIADIEKISPLGSSVPWTKVSVVVKKASGSVVLKKTTVSEDTNNYGRGIEAWYVDTVGERDLVNQWDSILVSGLTEKHEGGKIVIYYKDDKVATMNLPIDFS